VYVIHSHSHYFILLVSVKL